MGALSYLDYNATAPVRPAAARAVARMLEVGGNPSSIHGVGRAARAVLEDAREVVAAQTGGRAQDVIFTSGATEALHRALDAAEGAFGDLLVSSIEHDALWDCGGVRRVIACDPDGRISLDSLEDQLAGAARPLVAVMLANNETGVIQPIQKIAPRVREAGGLLLVDAVQALGRIRVDLQALDASYLVVSSHKVGGPPGAGALVLSPGAPFSISRRGGGQEQGRRPGTENVPMIAGFAAALQENTGSEAGRVEGLRRAFEEGLRARFRGVVVFGAEAQRLPNTCLFAVPGLPAEAALIALDLRGVAMSSGAACSSGKVKSSRVLAAMGVEPSLARCALRASFGWASRDEDVVCALDALGSLRANGLVGAV